MRILPHLGILVLPVLVLAAAAAPVSAQSVESDLRSLGVINAQRYVEPLTRGMTLAMGGGLFDGGAALDALGFDVGARVAGALPPASAERFEAVLPESITWESGGSGGTFDDPYRARDGDLRTPTLAGEGPGIVLEPSGDFRSALVQAGEDPSDYEVTLPSGRDTPLIPYPVLHASLGVGLGTELTLRYLPALEVDVELGHLRGFGFGARHQVTRWFSSPIDVSVVAARQEVKIGEYGEASTTQYGVVAGGELGPLALFASGIVREGTVDIRYEVDNPGDENPVLPPDGTRIAFSEEVETGAAFGLGARLQLLFLNLAGHYTFDDYSLVTLKVGFGDG